MTNPLTDLRAFAWDLLPDLAALVNDVQGPSGATVADDAAHLAERLRAPGVDAEADCRLAYVDGAPAGSMLLNWELPIGCVALEGGVRREQRGLGVESALLGWAMAQGRAGGAAAARVPAVDGDTAASAFLESQGFRPVRRHQALRWTPGAVPEPTLPAGVALRRFQPGDEAALTEAQNAAFDGQWGFSPNTVEQLAYTVGMRRVTPEGVALLMDGDAVAAYCITQLAGGAAAPAGGVHMLGVHPRHQGRGLGRAALLAGMRLLLERGAASIELTVDAENGAALGLYASAGFLPSGGRTWYEASLTVDA